MLHNICYSADDDRSSASARVTALKAWLDFVLPHHNWSVVATHKTGFEHRHFAPSDDGLSQASEEICGWDGDRADDRMELGYFGNLATITSTSDFDRDRSPVG